MTLTSRTFFAFGIEAVSPQYDFGGAPELAALDVNDAFATVAN